MRLVWVLVILGWGIMAHADVLPSAQGGQGTARGDVPIPSVSFSQALGWSIGEAATETAGRRSPMDMPDWYRQLLAEAHAESRAAVRGYW